MDSEKGGLSSRDLQKQTASQIARKKVLVAYAQSAQKTTRSVENHETHMKDEPITTRINSESWKKYHSAWQNYYQKYYNDYYSKAAQNYIKQERLKDANSKVEEERILNSLMRASIKPDQKAGLKLNPEEDSNNQPTNKDIKQRLRETIRKKSNEDEKKAKHKKRLIPIIIGVSVTLLILFLQYNRLIFAPIMAYVSPGNAPASQIEAVDPTVTQTISAEPRLIIPKLNIDVPVHFGIPLNEVMSAMNEGVAHYRINGASAYPGEIGNLVITGHSAGDIYSSNQYKYIFSGLERLEDGDLIYVNYNSVRYTYRVIKKEVIEPSDINALVVETDKPLITLVTCTPLGTSRYRLLVTGEQISPSYEDAEESKGTVTIDQNDGSELPSNEPTFFEGTWNWITGN